MVVRLRDSFVDREKSIVILWTPRDRQKWQQTDRQHSRRLEESPNGLSGFYCISSSYRLSLRHNETRSMPSTCAATVWLPPDSCSTQRM